VNIKNWCTNQSGENRGDFRIFFVHRFMMVLPPAHCCFSTLKRFSKPLDLLGKPWLVVEHMDNIP